MKNTGYKATITLKVKDEDIKRIKNDISDSSKSVKSIRVKIEATHAGIVNGNKKFYLPVGMKNGTDSFVANYKKPVTINHDPYASPLGRVAEAAYVKYGLDSTIDNLRPNGKIDLKFIDKINKFVKSSTYRDSAYKGLGHIELVAEISDEDGIQKILDGRYLTVSIGGGSNAMYCSICGVDNKRHSCDHYPGIIYDEQECFFISGDIMYFDHVSYVNSPADKNTNTELLDSVDSKITILDYVITNKGNKMKLKDLLQSQYDTYEKIADFMQKTGIGKSANKDSAALAKELDHVLSDEKILPIHDKAHALVARMIVQDLEAEQEDKDAALTVIDEKLAALIGKEFSIADEVEKLKEQEKEEPVLAKNNLTLSEDSITVIVTKVVEELHKSFNVSDSYSTARLKALQKAHLALEDEVQALSGKLRDNTIIQILTLEDKLDNTEYKDELSKRSINSLEDKLTDLVKSKPVKQKNLEPNSLDSQDGKGDNTDTSVPAKTPVTDNKKTSSEIIDEYKTLMRTKGISAAKGYIQKLRDEKQLPDNFNLNGVK